MRATSIAHHVFPNFRDATVSVDLALADVRGFNPASTTRRFRIAMSELGEIGWLLRIAKEINLIAPGVRVEVVPLDPTVLADWLSRGVVDVAVAPSYLAGEYRRTVVKWNEYGISMSIANPLAAGAISLNDYATYPRAVVQSDSGAPILEAAEIRAGVGVEASVVVQHYATLPGLLIARPTLLAAIPISIAEGWSATWPVTIRPLPFEMAPVQLRVYRRAGSQEAVALDWFYELVCRVISTTAARFDIIQGHSARN